MNTTKAQRRKLYNSAPGQGWFVMLTADKEISEIEIYFGRDGTLRRVGNGQPLLPIPLRDEENNTFICNKAC